MSTATTDNEDVMIVDNNDTALLTSLGDLAEKPLIMLFLRLIGNDTKQNTVLTNAQIIDILQKEFEMDIVYTHELEVEIYLNLLKRFLKDWPQWDEFDFDINILKDQKNIAKMKDMLQSNYGSLKKYLQSMLTAVDPMLKKVIKEVNKSTVREPTTTSNDEVAIEVKCTRQQLNELFFRRPHPEQNNTIFNIELPSEKIRLQPVAVQSILNWPGIRISISIPGLMYKREIKMPLKHLLINKKLNYPPPPLQEAKTNYQVRTARMTNHVDVKTFYDIIHRIGNGKYRNQDLMDKIWMLSALIKSDLEEAPKYIYSPSSYRQNLSKYPYKRLLCAEVNSDSFSSNNYDLVLEESGIPQLQYHFIRFSDPELEITQDGSFLKLECTLCECIFAGAYMFSMIQAHFEFHRGEKDYECSGCHVVFSMEQLTASKWRHVCDHDLSK
ncbi:uncharacterized protein LOC114353012 [Ostrinia furnacalis]|uniref:uncharacterized protein LOC114353012 n=1 Tax=Ostrinia furnacalis TaxID=93504 RepID=UPI00103E2E89|nr:uncharacterized protein LOC114353012 [Ostrinia furnacalis]